ncbi:MAG: SDR family oxidoreductase [Gammaproteobacteria bacterium]|nr:SDR family oxidoreductase [Gammaproteobacteria bacterium]
MCDVKRCFLVTGASSGIGLAIAKQLLQQGHQVVGFSRDFSKIDIINDNFFPVRIDLAQLNALPGKLKELEQQFPSLDGVVFSAGMGRFGSLEEFSFEQINELMTINFTSPVMMTRVLLPKLKRKNRADLIYIGSEAALKGSRKGSVYCASKFALRGFTQALREECGTSPVRISLINPGMVRTPFFDRLAFEPGDDENNFLLPEDVAEAVSYVINARPQMVVDEINLNPSSKVVKKK